MAPDRSDSEAMVAVKRAVDLTELYADAIVRISQVLNAEHLRDAGKLAKIRLVIASLDPKSREDSSS
jgi:hypothetical protein